MSNLTREIGRLVPVDLREVWPLETTHFTPWLAQSDNLTFLAESLGIPGLELVQSEHAVDSFSADIVARIVDSEDFVLIENQLDRTDHKHLGQLLAYAPHFDAKVIVWIARQFTDAHRASIDWLNRITDERYAFFGVEVQAVRIEKLPAPLFNVVAQPNRWTRATQSLPGAAPDKPLNAIALSNLDYWEAFHKAAVAAGAPLRRAKRPLKDTNYWVPITSNSDAYLSAWRSQSRTPVVGVFACWYNAPAAYVAERISAQQAEIEAEFEEPLQWERNKEGNLGRALIRLPVADPADRTDWPRQHAWLITMLKKFDAVLSPRIVQALAEFREGSFDKSIDSSEIEGL